MIELDGGHHASEPAKAYDENRTKYLESQGLRVLRFWNNEVLTKTTEVLEEICRYFEKTLTPTLSQQERGQNQIPSLSGGGLGWGLSTNEKNNAKGQGYTPFEGIVLTDTFQLAEGEGRIEGVFPANSQRAEKQRQNDIRVIIGNPPYSAGQKSQNDNNKNLEYPYLDKRINDTYVEESTASLSRFVYDSYIRAIRWASDRIKDKGIICFVTNVSFMDGNAMDGVRKCLVKDFTSLYVFNLRGNQRTQGETSRQEGGKIFDGGSRATIAITLLIKNPEKKRNPHPNPLPTGEGVETNSDLEPSPFGRGQGEGAAILPLPLGEGWGEGAKANLYYYDIGDYLDRKTKLRMIEEFKSVENIPWKRLTPNSNHDWINQRDPAFDAFLSLGDKTDKTSTPLFASADSSKKRSTRGSG